MANLSNQIKAFLISKGKTNDEINSLFYSEKILLESIDEIVEISKENEVSNNHEKKVDEKIEEEKKDKNNVEKIEEINNEE